MERATTKPVDGIDGPNVTRWLAAHAGLGAPLSFRLIAGGRSNLTYEVVDATGRRVILRRPPLGAVLESAHDMGREYRIASALRGTAVPVAEQFGYCEDPAITGAPFTVMAFVDGATIRDEADVEAALDLAGRHAAGLSMVDVLADLHGVDPDAVGLGQLGRRDGYVARQLRRWYGQFERSKSREVPAIDAAHAALSARIPPQHGAAIVHGDYRIDNCVLGPDGTVRAVLDWELCTLGDPLADVGLLLVYWARPGRPGSAVLTGAPTAMEGFADHEELVARYVARTGADVSQLDFYVALALWKIACIADGIRARYQAGVMGDDGSDADRFANQAELLAEQALAVFDAPR